jgi:ubiquinone biosynthesis protein
MGRSLCPGINMWGLALPLVEDWMRANRNPAARLVDQMAESAEMLRRLPVLLGEIELATRRIAAGELIPSQNRGILARLWPLWFTGMVVALATLAAIALD